MFYLMQYVHFGTLMTPSECLNLLHQVEFAEQHYGLRDCPWWYWHTDSLFSALGLLIPCLQSSIADLNGLSSLSKR